MGTLVTRHRDRSPVRWANGAGTTVELVALEESADLTPGLPRWRLSVASLERPAPFSPLPGLHRRFLPVGGDVVLTVDGVRTPVPAGGALAVALEPSGGVGRFDVIRCSGPAAHTSAHGGAWAHIELT